MPNYCQNHLIVKSNNLDKITALHNAVIKENLLEYLVPYPKDMDEDSEQAYIFRMGNWGVKWDISAPTILKEIEKENENDCYVFECYFQTPWDSPVVAFETYCGDDDDLYIEIEYIEFGMMFGGLFNSNWGHVHYDDITKCTENDLPFFYEDLQDILLDS